MLWFVNWCILFDALYAKVIICLSKLYYPVTFIFSHLFFKGGVVFCFKASHNYYSEFFPNVFVRKLSW